MTQTRYQIYRNQVFRLAKTMVVKFDMAARTMNRELENMGYTVNHEDPSTWKYYMNLAGEYHDTDTAMVIDSLDDPGTQIEFTVDNLAISRITRAQYSYGSRFYGQLVNRYPEQEELILGILHPVDKQRAIEAREGEILWFDESLVEDNETRLIDNIQTWIYNFLDRWHIQDYVGVDDLYPAAQIGVMFANMPGVILNERLNNCKTNHAHSYHIREYLESNGKLAPYIKYLTKKQALFLYRNIHYIQKHAGKQHVFDMLVENVLSERNIPLAEYTIRHNLSHLTEELRNKTRLTGDDTQAYTPQLEMVRRPLNFIHIGSGSQRRSVEYVLNKEDELTPMDSVEYDRQLEDIYHKGEKHDRNVIQTKALESAMVDTTDSVAFPLDEVLLNHWMYYAHTGLYNSQIRLTNPSTGEPLIIGVDEAVILYIYCVRHGDLVDDPDNSETTPETTDPITVSDEIPTIGVRMIRRDPQPPEQELWDVVSPNYVTQDTVDEALSVEYFSQAMSTPDEFYDACVEIQKGLMRHRDIYAQQEHHMARAMTEYMISLFYQNQLLEFVPAGTTFTEWFDSKEFDLTGLEESEYRQLSTEIIEKATGTGVNASKQLRERQRGLLELMRALSSYSVQYFRTINSSKTLIIDRPSIRVGDLGTPGWDAVNDDAEIRETSRAPLNILSADAVGQYHDYFVDIKLHGEDIDPETKSGAGDTVTAETGTRMSSRQTFHPGITVPLPNVRVLQRDLVSENIDTTIVVDDVPDYKYPDNLE